MRATIRRWRHHSGRWPAVVAGALLVAGVAGVILWRQRWHISRRAIEMADVSVRKWAHDEVHRLSHGAYSLTTSPLRVDEANRRISVDTITVVTDSAEAGRGDTPLPLITLRFQNCALRGIDLARLVAGRGLHVEAAGCDSVAVVARMNTTGGRGDSLARTDSTSFLTLSRNLKLPRQIPTIQIDSVRFPVMHLAASLGAGNRRAQVQLDRLAVRLDSLYYDPHQRPEARRTLLSRNAVVTLDHFQGNQASANRLDIERLAMDLAQGTVSLDGLVFDPIPGGRTDSLGFTALEVARLRLQGVNWRALIVDGDVRVRLVELDTARMTIVPARYRPESGMASPPTTLETSLRAVDRLVRIDTLVARQLELLSRASAARAGGRTSVGLLRVTGVAFSAENADWAGTFPVGRLTVMMSDLRGAAGTNQFGASHLALDLPAGTMEADGITYGPPGTDAEFLKRSRYRHDRLTFAADTVQVLGADFLGLIRTGQYAMRRIDAAGLSVDVLVDHGLPDDPAPRARHRTPQAALRGMGLSYRVDTTLVRRGRVSLREREADAPSPGVLTFEAMRATITGFNNQVPGATDSAPMEISLDSRLMNSAPVHIDASMPLSAKDFRMTFRASIGGFPAGALNPFLVNATGIRFQDGTVHDIRIAMSVTGGRATGTVAPRWEGLQVELPGVARGDHGLFGGIKRGIAKFAANNFAVRSDNITTAKANARDGAIDHRWTPSEAFPAFLWHAIGDPLKALLKH